MPLIRTIRPRMLAAKPLPKLPMADDVTGDFPVEVVVDSGVADVVPGLESWIVGRDSQVAPEYRNTDHGTLRGRFNLLGWPTESDDRRDR